MPKTQAALLSSITQTFSRDRISKYHQPGDTAKDVLARYTWNIMLCEALYPALQNLEVAMRNSMHAAISGPSGYNRLDWYDHPGLLLPNENKAVTKAKNILVNKGRNLTPGRIIAELSFGFWTTLFDRPYETKPGDPRLWPRLLIEVLPNMPSSDRTRANALSRFNSIRELRNRVSHHEPIHHLPDLDARHQQILDAISWISTDARDLTTLFDRFVLVHAGGKAYCTSHLDLIAT